MRNFKKLLCLFLAVVLLFGFSACTSKKTENKASEKTAMRTITDSCGRSVKIPSKIKKIAPSGALAQIVLYTLCRDKLVGLSGDFTDISKKYIDKKYYNLPKFGQFYGKNVSLNMEALIKASPDVIIDIGEAKPTIKKDMDDLQSQLGIPVIFVEATLKNMDGAYKKLGEITGDESKASVLSTYCKNTLKDISKKSAEVKSKVSIYYALGNTGLNTNAAGSIHADVIEAIGADNVAKVQLVSSGGGSLVSMEQILKWNPEVIITAPNGLYSKIKSDPLWQNLSAVKNGKVYEIPNGPYNFMGEPPSINRIIGLKWLGNLIYPDVYKYDMINEVQDFYKKFYYVKLSKNDAKELLKNSTFK